MTTRAFAPWQSRALVAALAVSCLQLAERSAQAGPSDEEIVGMVWRHQISKRTEKSRIKKYGVGPFADGQSRLETELRSTIDLKRLPEARARMDALAADRRAAARVFGKNHRVVKLSKRPRKVWDIYVDTPDGRLANNNAALRIRIENGTAQLNYKPPKGEFLPEGLKIGVENGITLNADPVTGQLNPEVMAFFKNTRLVDNPLKELKRQFPTLEIEDFFFTQLEVKQNRQIYEVQELEGGQWVKKSEVSVDRVRARDPSDKFRVVFGRVELEGDHVSAGALSASQLVKVANRPHRQRDQQNRSFRESKDVKQIRGYVTAVTKYLDVLPVPYSKYLSSRGRLAAKGADFKSGRYMIKGVRRSRTAYRTAAAASARRAKAKPKAPARGR